MTDKQRIQQLAQKFLEGTATGAEQAELHAWYDESNTGDEIPEHAASLHRRMKQRINARTGGAARVIRGLSVAAAIAAVVTAGIYLWPHTQTTPHAVMASQEERFQQDVKPGGNKATLTLGDGSVMELDTLRNGALAAQGATQIIKYNGAQLAYNSAPEGEVPRPFTYNTISTPRGGQYQVVLPDGTKVWLNASSSLRFPTAFVSNERKVELHGEAYFKVAQRANQPFFVQVDGMQVQVLGTEFNVMAYDNEQWVKTSLLKGAVKVSSGSNTTPVMKPGQQARLTGAGNLLVSNDPFIEDVAAWKEGMFVFNNEALDGIMRQLSRWYNVEVDFTSNGLKKKLFTGQIARNENLSEVLKMLELTDAVHFRIENATVAVMP